MHNDLHHLYNYNKLTTEAAGTTTTTAAAAITTTTTTTTIIIITTTTTTTTNFKLIDLSAYGKYFKQGSQSTKQCNHQKALKYKKGSCHLQQF